MKNIEYKSIDLELKDFNKGKREAVIAHATYNNIDLTKDIARKGMFNKSWRERKGDIELYVNHDPDRVPGKPLDFWEDDSHAYTKAYFGTHTLGNDTLIMLDEGIIRKASFGYIPEKKDYLTIKGEKIRELKEVMHVETSVLTVRQANPLSKIVSVSKSLDSNDINELKQSIEAMEKFCRNSNASDDCIKSILNEIDEARKILLKYDTVDTEPLSNTQPAASGNKEDEKAFADSLYLLTLKTFS